MAGLLRKLAQASLFAWTALLAAFPAVIARADEIPVALLTDGTQRRALVHAIDNAGNIELASEQDVRTLAADQLVEWGSPIESYRDGLVMLSDGSLLPGDVVAIGEESLSLESACLGNLTLPLEEVRGALTAPPTTARRDNLLAELGGARGDADRLLLANGDQWTGRLLGLKDRRLRFEADLGAVEVPLDAAEGVIFDPSLVTPPAAPRWLVGLRDGSLLFCRQVTCGESLIKLQSACGLPCDADRRTLRYLSPRGDRLHYLSDLPPRGYKHVPFLGLAWPYRLDRNVADARLRSGGRWYPKGIGMHSASRLTFALGPDDQRLDAELALDDSVGARGSVVFRVFVDNEQRFASQIVRGGDLPLPISVDVAGGSSVSLVVDFAERGDELDHANWLNARLVQR